MIIKVVRNRKPKPEQKSKLVMKASEHAQRKAQAQEMHTHKPQRLDERTANRLIGFAVIITIISVVTLLLAVAGQ